VVGFRSADYTPKAVRERAGLQKAFLMTQVCPQSISIIKRKNYTECSNVEFSRGRLLIRVDIMIIGLGN